MQTLRRYRAGKAGLDREHRLPVVVERAGAQEHGGILPVVLLDDGEALPQPLGAVAPVLLCTLGGVLVGVATSHTGFSLDTLGVVVGHCRTEGDCQVKSWPWALVLFALPIAFGGAAGPEAGVSGFTAALGTMAMHGMRRSGVAVARNTTHPLAAAWKALSPAASDTLVCVPPRTGARVYSSPRATARLRAKAAKPYSYSAA